MPKIALSNICKLMAAMHLEFSIDHCYFFKSIVKNEFLTPKYSRIEVLVMIVAPQDQFYIETNLAIAHLHNLFNMLIYPPYT